MNVLTCSGRKVNTQNPSFWLCCVQPKVTHGFENQQQVTRGSSSSIYSILWSIRSNSTNHDKHIDSNIRYRYNETKFRKFKNWQSIGNKCDIFFVRLGRRGNLFANLRRVVSWFVLIGLMTTRLNKYYY